MTALQWLQIFSNGASIVTAGLAAFAYGRYLADRRKKRLRLEDYLKSEKLKKPGGEFMHTLVHLTAQLGLTEAEILDAAFRSRSVIRDVSIDANGHASKLLLGYSEPNVAS